MRTAEYLHINIYCPSFTSQLNKVLSELDIEIPVGFFSGILAGFTDPSWLNYKD